MEALSGAIKCVQIVFLNNYFDSGSQTKLAIADFMDKQVNTKPSLEDIQKEMQLIFEMCIELTHFFDKDLLEQNFQERCWLVCVELFDLKV